MGEEKPNGSGGGLIARMIEGVRQRRSSMTYPSQAVEAAGQARSDALSTEVVAGLKNGEFSLHYQPKINLRHRNIVSHEALLRWAHPVRGFVSPAEFIPAIEDGPAIKPLSEWVFTTAIEDQIRLRDLGHDLPIYVNVAACLLSDASFISHMCDEIEDAGGRIGIEITETSVISDPDVAISNLDFAHSRGVPIAIDDYGAGLSSLAYLKRLPATELKIDKIFITQLTTTNRDPLIVRSTIDLAHAMEMNVVAEGIEDETALALLSVMGCDMAQGYHISRPLAFNDLVQFLNEYEAKLEDGATKTLSAADRLSLLRR